VGSGALFLTDRLAAGRKASMASTKVWSHGDIRLIDMSEATDYGQAVAMTRLGVTGGGRTCDTLDAVSQGLQVCHCSATHPSRSLHTPSIA
jgi:hypothetical protein